MTTNALMELADRLANEAHKWTACGYDTDLSSMLREAATQLRTAAAEGGEKTQPRVHMFAVPEGLHPDTEALVGRFAYALAEKLAMAERKYGWADHWKSNAWMDQCRQQLVEHVAKGDPRDVAAYAMFLWHHGEPTTIEPSAHPWGFLHTLSDGRWKVTKGSQHGGGFDTWAAESAPLYLHPPTDSGAGRDGARMDWLERQHVEVRKPARYGSFAKFHASPNEEDEPSDLRQRIDTAIAGAAGEAR